MAELSDAMAASELTAGGTRLRTQMKDKMSKRGEVPKFENMMGVRCKSRQLTWRSWWTAKMMMEEA